MVQRSALVTGASRGIGFAIADMLASEGHALTIVARSADDLDTARERLSRHGVPVQALTGNVAKERDIRQALETHQREYGALHVLINNAGTGIHAPLSIQTERQIDLQLSVNLRSVITTCRLAQPLLEKACSHSGNALVVNLASISGKVGSSSLSVYAATKHGVVGFTDSLNRELYDTGVRYVALCPGFVDTSLSDYVKEHLSAEEMIQPNDIVESVRFLLRLSPACLVPEIVFMEAAALGLTRTPTRPGREDS